MGLRRGVRGERNFQGDDFIRLNGEIGESEIGVAGGFNGEFVMRGRKREDAEEAFAVCGGAENLSGCEVAKRKLCAGNRCRSACDRSGADDAVKGGGVERLLARNANRGSGFARLSYLRRGRVGLRKLRGWGWRGAAGGHGKGRGQKKARGGVNHAGNED